MSLLLQARVERALSVAGVAVEVTDNRAYRSFFRGSLAVGDAYVAGWWRSPALDNLFATAIKKNMGLRINRPSRAWNAMGLVGRNRQRPGRVAQDIRAHYDRDPKFWCSMLGATMSYTCACWRDAETLEQAQQAKLDMVCRKLDLLPGMRLLDIGCGWGSLARYAAKHYDVEVTGITLSKPQAKFARWFCRDLPVTIDVRDYRRERRRFDRVAALGMFEHVGARNHRRFMLTVSRVLEPDGLALVHTIGKTRRGMTDPWIDRHIFPGGEIPTMEQIVNAAKGYLVIEDLENFGPDYDRTLMAWHRALEQNWPTFEDKYGVEFKRTWEYYLMQCAGAFRARALHLWQVVLSHQERAETYRRPCSPPRT